MKPMHQRTTTIPPSAIKIALATAKTGETSKVPDTFPSEAIVTSAKACVAPKKTEPSKIANLPKTEFKIFILNLQK